MLLEEGGAISSSHSIHDVQNNHFLEAAAENCSLLNKVVKKKSDFCLEAEAGFYFLIIVVFVYFELQVL